MALKFFWFSAFVQTTLLGIGVLPPPTAGPYIFSGLYGTGAGLTTNGRESFVVQYIIGYLVFINVGPNLFFAPAGKGVYFDQTVVFIPFYQGNVFACNGLSRPKTANPGIQFGKGTLQGFYFPQVTAKLPVFHTLVKEVDALFIYHFFDLLMLGKKHLDFCFVFARSTVNQVVGLRKESSRIQRKDAGFGIYLHQHVGQHLVFGTQTGRQGYFIAKFLEDLGQYFLRTRPL